MIGSANLTDGGLDDNWEASCLCSDVDGSVLKYINRLAKSDDLKTLTQVILEEYSNDYEIARTHLRMAKRRVQRLLQQGPARGHSSGATEEGLETLRDALSVMRQGGRSSEFDTQADIRARNRNLARRTLNHIRKLSAQNEFTHLYGKLAGGLWHSRGLARNKSRIAENVGSFQEIVETASKSAGKPIPATYDALRTIALRAPGIGPNVLTEVLQTFDNKRFAVMNKNSVRGMRLAGFTNFPEIPNKANVKGDLYREFSGSAEQLQHILGLKDLTQLDALFNFVYWQEDA